MRLVARQTQVQLLSRSWTALAAALDRMVVQQWCRQRLLLPTQEMQQLRQALTRSVAYAKLAQKLFRQEEVAPTLLKQPQWTPLSPRLPLLSQLRLRQPQRQQLPPHLRRLARLPLLSQRLRRTFDWQVSGRA
jgi:hypothetical protein